METTCTIPLDFSVYSNSLSPSLSLSLSFSLSLSITALPCLSLSPVDCEYPQLSAHGVCVGGECLCTSGWGGVNCDTPLPSCQEQCSGHGGYQPDVGVCVCEKGWTGTDCATGGVSSYSSFC